MFANFIGPQELVVLLVLGVLLFGRKLPELGRSIGKTVVEFKKGMNGLEDEISGNSSANRQAIEPEPARPPQRVTSPAAPKFEDSPETVGSSSGSGSNLPPQV